MFVKSYLHYNYLQESECLSVYFCKTGCKLLVIFKFFVVIITMAFISLLTNFQSLDTENVLFLFCLAQQWRVQVNTDGDSPEPLDCKRTLVIYGSKGKSDKILLSPQRSGHVCFLPRAMDEFIVSHKYTVLHRAPRDIPLQPKYMWNSGFVVKMTYLLPKTE